MAFSFVWTIINLILFLVICGAVIYLFVLLVKALKRYIGAAPARQEQQEIRRTLAQTLKEHRMAKNMTQEFVAETLGVSRQAVSKWESGASDPSTSNLIALARLYGVTAEELLRGKEAPGEEN